MGLGSVAREAGSSGLWGKILNCSLPFRFAHYLFSKPNTSLVSSYILTLTLLYLSAKRNCKISHLPHGFRFSSMDNSC